ncbi:MAG TPA: MFS transporter [Methanospirillum sp.]|nr:MFS transporter [Methanospirillum sp.]
MIRSSPHLIILFSGVFALMALSNAIIPVLPDLSETLQIQALIFSAYFFGAMVTTLPGGILCDRYGQTLVVRISLILTVFSGFLLIGVQDTVAIFIARVIEGVGAGLFVSAGLSWINYRPDHLQLSGFFMALLNGGLVIGLIGSGFLSSQTGILTSGILFFSVLSILPLLYSLKYPFERQHLPQDRKSLQHGESGISYLINQVLGMVFREAPLWISVVVLLGTTGFVQAIYPELSHLGAQDIGLVLALMNVATIIASLIAPSLNYEPVLLIRIAALCMGGLVLVFMEFPGAIFLMGFVAGIIMISQIGYLAASVEHQGIAMGLFSTSSYAGMTLIPAVGGYIVGIISAPAAAASVFVLCIISAVLIGRCKCRGFHPLT